MGWLLVAAVVWLSLVPQPPAQAVAVPDKVGHFAAYLVLALWFGGLYGGHRRTALSGGLVLLGAALEILQGQGFARQAELADLVADMLGVAAALLVPHPLLAGRIGLLEQALFGARR